MTRPTLKQKPKPAPKRSTVTELRPLRTLPRKPVKRRAWEVDARTKPGPYLRKSKTPYIRLNSDWDVDSIQTAKQSHQRGLFDQSGQLWLWCQESPRLKAVLRKRVGALSALPFSVEPASGEELATPYERAVAALVERAWFDVVPESLLRGIMRQAIGMGAALCRVQWTDRDGRWWPVLTLWPACDFYYQDSDDCWYAKTRQGGDVKVNAGCGWFLWLPDGERSFQTGAVVSLSLECLIANMSRADWANYNASVASIVKKVKVPRGALTTVKDAFFDNVDGIGRDSNTVMCEVNLDGASFDFEYVPADTGDVDTFERSQGSAEKAITIEILGQEKTTDLGGEGARSAVEALAGIEDTIIAADANGFATAFRAQVLAPFCEYNFADSSLAPWPKWETEAAEDNAVAANTFRGISYALGAMRASYAGTGLKLNMEAFSEKFGVDVLPGNDIPPTMQATLDAADAAGPDASPAEAPVDGAPPA